MYKKQLAFTIFNQYRHNARVMCVCVCIMQNSYFFLVKTIIFQKRKKYQIFICALKMQAYLL